MSFHKNIVAFFDLKCFQLDDFTRKLIPREFALVDEHATHHGLIDHGHSATEIPAGDIWNIDVAEQRGLGINFNPAEGDMREADLETFLKDYYCAHRTSQKFLIAYHHAAAWKMLNQCNIPYVKVDVGKMESCCHLHKIQPEGAETVEHWCALATCKSMFVKNKLIKTAV